MSSLAGCAALRTLDMTMCVGVTDVSPLAGCAALRTLDMTMCAGLMDVSALEQRESPVTNKRAQKEVYKKTTNVIAHLNIPSL